ncbi:phage repressor protein/antirepressor Ant [Bacillus cereus]|nr:phage repressor protein/antirepressor Ant [Bacillus cereus]PGV88245.1 phage repressor protein/antirepressor Ant [Bacillus cereus]
MNQLLVFNNKEFGQVRTVAQGEEVLFVAQDVCDVLGINKQRDAYSRLDEDERGSVLVDTLGGQQNVNAINESGLYSLILRSRKPQAKAFKKWVTSEVLPSIRKHGAYMTDQVLEQAVTNPDFAIGLLTKLKEEKEKLVVAQQQIEEQKHKVLFAESVQASKNSILVKELAVLLKQNGVNVGQNRLFQYFRENGYLCSKKGNMFNSPTQKSMDRGLFESHPYIRTNREGEFVTSFTPKVTGKGQLYFINKFLNQEAV